MTFELFSFWISHGIIETAQANSAIFQEKQNKHKQEVLVNIHFHGISQKQKQNLKIIIVCVCSQIM